MRAVKTPPPSAWLAQVEGARSVAELLRAMRDYLASLDPEEIAHLPKGVAPDTLRFADDIQACAVTLAHEDLRQGANAPASLHRSAMVFAAAAAKVPRLAE